MPKVRIQTSQNVFIEFETASLGDRILAGIIDILILFSYIIAILYFSNKLNINSTLYYLIAFIPYAFYHLLSEILLNGQSVGKKARKIKVTRLDGSEPTVGNYILRWILRPIDSLPFAYGIAIIAISANGKGQRLGDLAAGTTVVSLERRVNIEDTILPIVGDDYIPVYLNASSLSDKDIELIREVVGIYMKNNNFESDLLLHKLSDKIKNILQVDSHLSPISFLEIIVKDHAFLTGK